MRGRYHRVPAQVWILLAGSCTKRERERPKGLSHSLALFSSVSCGKASDKHCKGLAGRGEREGGREGGREGEREGGREGLSLTVSVAVVQVESSWHSGA